MTRTLILTRHAKSSWEHPGLEDHDRPLNKRGERSAAALGDWMRDKGWIPDEILCSSARRTRETCAGLKLGEIPTTNTRDLYHATGNQMLRVLSRASGNTVLMLAHNPGIGSFAAELAGKPPKHPRFADFPTGATVVLEFDVDDWSRAGWRSGKVLDFAIPRELLKE